MQNYPSNSHSYKAEIAEQEAGEKKERKIEKVVTGGTTRVKKKSEIRKFTDLFVSEDASSVKKYILMDVVVPGVKRIISNIVKDGIDIILGEGGRTNAGYGDRFGSTYVSYNTKFNSKNNVQTYNDNRTRSSVDYGDIVFEYRGEAEAVRDQMEAVIDRYGYVTIADMYEMANQPAPPYTSIKYGWTNIRNAEIVRAIGGGYVIKLPRAYPLDK